MTLFSTTARVPTESGVRYVAQLAKHWAHSLSVEQDERWARITFPRDARGADWPADALVTMTADDAGIDCRIDASAPGQRDAFKGALARHLDRFAFREAPLRFDWQDR